MNTIRIKSTHPESQGPFVIISRADFDAAIHEPVDPADLDDLVEQPRVLTTQDVAAARAELERMHADIIAERARLDAQAAEQETERVRLAEAAKLAEQGAEAGKLTIAQLRDELTARAIAFDPAAKKADLQALLDAAPAQ